MSADIRIRVRANRDGGRTVTVTVPVEKCIAATGLASGDVVAQANIIAMEQASHALAERTGIGVDLPMARMSVDDAAELAAFRAQCDAAGVPRDPGGQVAPAFDRRDLAHRLCMSQTSVEHMEQTDDEPCTRCLTWADTIVGAPDEPAQRSPQLDAAIRRVMAQEGCRVLQDEGDCAHVDDTTPCRCIRGYAYCQTHDWEDGWDEHVTTCAWAARIARTALGLESGA